MSNGLRTETFGPTTFYDKCAGCQKDFEKGELILNGIATCCGHQAPCEGALCRACVGAAQLFLKDGVNELIPMPERTT